MVTMSVFNSHCVGFNRYCRLISSHSLISLISTSNRHPYPYHSTAISTTTLCAKSDTDNERKPISKYRTESSNEYARHQNNKIITGDSSSSSSSGVRLNKCLLGLSRRAADTAIAEGRVTIDGKVVTAAGTRVAEKSVVRLDGKVGANKYMSHVSIHVKLTFTFRSVKTGNLGVKRKKFHRPLRLRRDILYT